MAHVLQSLRSRLVAPELQVLYVASVLWMRALRATYALSVDTPVAGFLGMLMPLRGTSAPTVDTLEERLDAGAGPIDVLLLLSLADSLVLVRLVMMGLLAASLADVAGVSVLRLLVELVTVDAAAGVPFGADRADMRLDTPLAPVTDRFVSSPLVADEWPSWSDLAPPELVVVRRAAEVPGGGRVGGLLRVLPGREDVEEDKDFAASREEVVSAAERPVVAPGAGRLTVEEMGCLFGATFSFGGDFIADEAVASFRGVTGLNGVAASAGGAAASGADAPSDAEGASAML